MKKLLFASLFGYVLIFFGAFWAIQKLGGISYLKYKMQNRGLGAAYGHRVDLFNSLSIPDSSIVLLGNSLTEQGEWSELLGQPVYNRGIVGDGTQGVLNRLPVIIKSKPNHLFLMIGLNDLIGHSPQFIIDNYHKIISSIQTSSPHTKIYIQSLLPVNNQIRPSGFHNEDIQRVNKSLRSISAQYQLEYLELYSLFANSQGQLHPDYSSDGIHLNGAGYLIWAQELKEYL